MKTISAKQLQLFAAAFFIYFLFGLGAAYNGIPGAWVGIFLGIWTWTVMLSKFRLINGVLSFGNAALLIIGLALPYLVILGIPFLLQILKYTLAGFAMSMLFTITYGMSSIDKEEVERFFMGQ